MNTFDKRSLITIGILLAFLGLTLIRGDQVGVLVMAIPASPALTSIHMTTPFRLQFSESMDRPSVEMAVSIKPSLAGAWHWLDDQQVEFIPSIAWLADATYLVHLEAGAVSTAQRRVLHDQDWSFHVVNPYIVFLAPAEPTAQPTAVNLWMVPLAPNNMPPQQLTFHELDVLNFRPSPQGMLVAYSKANADGTADIYTINVDTLETRRITHCVQAVCSAPDWSPDGQQLVYQRTEIAPSLPAIEQGAARAWLVNLSDLSTVPVFSQSEFLGAAPQWSADGTKLIMYDRNAKAIVIVALKDRSRQLLHTLEGENGEYQLDRTGRWLVFPELAQVNSLFVTEMRLADLQEQSITALKAEGDLVNDFSPTWNPATGLITLARYRLAGQDGPTPQVYSIDPKTFQSKPVVIDQHYRHAALSWTPDGSMLLMQRRSVEGGTPSIWFYDSRLQTVTKVADNGFLPQWLP